MTARFLLKAQCLLIFVISSPSLSLGWMRPKGLRRSSYHKAGSHIAGVEYEEVHVDFR